MSLATFITSHIPNPLPSYLTSYQPPLTPLSNGSHVIAALVSYLVTVFSIKFIMKDRKPVQLSLLWQAHNLILSVGSLVLLVLMVEEIVPIVWNRGIFYGICGRDAWTPRLEFYYMINYYIKYLELLDTVYLALKKKPLAFLHVFHHSATALLCYSQLNGKTSVSWTVISLNLTVHVLMYYYYFATAGGRKIWWKKYLTTMQITQFIIDLFIVYFATYSYFASTYYHSLPTFGSCAGTESAAIFGCVLLSSYLLLFIDFYMRTYKPKGEKTVGNGVGKVNGVAIAVGNGNGKANGKAN